MRACKGVLLIAAAGGCLGHNKWLWWGTRGLTVAHGAEVAQEHGAPPPAEVLPQFQAERPLVDLIKEAEDQGGGLERLFYKTRSGGTRRPPRVPRDPTLTNSGKPRDPDDRMLWGAPCPGDVCATTAPVLRHAGSPTSQ